MSLKHCTDILRKNNCIAFIGAGVSRTYYDDKNIKEYQGFPTAQEFVQLLIGKDSDLIKTAMSFEQACFLYKNRYKKHGLISLLKETYNKNINPLPTHLLLAELPFSAYISMNYDTLLELSLKGSSKKIHRIVSDKDITRLHHSDVPLIYPHGCIAEPDSCLTTTDEIYPFFKDKPLIKSLIKVLLSSKQIIFFGFSLSDNDFHELYRDLNRILDNNMPLSYAVIKDFDFYIKSYWEKQGVEIINQDLTEFLRNLFLEYYGRVYKESKNAWILNEFYISLHGIHNIPSESQAIDSFINHLQEELGSTAINIKSLAERAKIAYEYLIKFRPNFKAFEKITVEALNAFKNGDLSKIQNNIQDLKDRRENISRKIKNKSRKMDKLHKLLKGGALLFSQSNRVIDVLSCIPKAIQEECTLYIAECRPKSPSSFQDALSFYNKIKETSYQKIIIPDIIMGSLFHNDKISCALLGVHTIIKNNNNIIKFVNTAGSLIITHLCLIYKKPLILVAESDKETEDMTVSLEEEACLTTRLDPNVRAHISKENRLDTKNIGYDEVQCEELIKKDLLIYINEN